jgi:hypothetical protein
MLALAARLLAHRRQPSSASGYNSAMNLVDQVRLDRSAFQIGSLDDEDPDKAYWQTKSPQERMEALELLRQIIYGYDPATTRLQRVLEVAELE